MKIIFQIQSIPISIFLIFSCLAVVIGSAQILYETGFESIDGYRVNSPLNGQNNWESNGGDLVGLVENNFFSRGQQAVFSYAPANDNPLTFLGRDLNIVPKKNYIIEFSVLMTITASSNSISDIFSWRFLNADFDELFSIIFANASQTIHVDVGNTNQIGPAIYEYANGLIPSQLVVSMDFTNNLWSLRYGGLRLIVDQPITPTGLDLNLNAVALFGQSDNPRNPGDNAVIFDDYKIVSKMQLPEIPIYSSHFEFDEGYSDQTLTDQNGWFVGDFFGNGIENNFFPGFGRQVFIGSNTEGADPSNIMFRPILYIPGENDLIEISALVYVEDSSNMHWDIFTWSIFSTNGDPLFGISFNNDNLNMSYSLFGGTSPVPTELQFTNGVIYDFSLFMDFSKKTWSASLGGVFFVKNKPLTTTTSDLDVGFIAVSWVPLIPATPGDNFMIFDNLIVDESSAAIDEVVYETHFESSEGYLNDFPLSLQNGWFLTGFDSSGLVNDFFPRRGNHAFIGFDASNAEDAIFSSIFHRIPFCPVGNESLQISLEMAIYDSKNEEPDVFSWTIYNSDDQPLFSIDFFNSTLEINFDLHDGNGLRSTSRFFNNFSIFHLDIYTNFLENKWSAMIDSELIIDDHPIATSGMVRDLLILEASWSFLNPNLPGDNYMVFDDIHIKTIDLTGTQTFPLTLNSGWNLISFPITPVTDVYSSIKNVIGGHIWGWDGQTMFKENNLTTGWGYFVYYLGNRTELNIIGETSQVQTLDLLPSAWNLFGVKENPPYANSQLNTKINNPQSLESALWTWDGKKFIVVDELVPGRGYWIKNGEVGLF